MSIDPSPNTTPSPAPQAQAVLSARNIQRSFSVGERELTVLHGINFDLQPGELVALVGASGAGKSTLLQILGLLDKPNTGEVYVHGQDPWKLDAKARAGVRNKRIGFVFQFYHLLPELTALENVVLPAMISESNLGYRARKQEFESKARAMLEHFGLAERLKHKPAQLSGGERQRVAMARALFQDPQILLADEPTGNLDQATGEVVLEMLFEEQKQRNLAMILVTHDRSLAERCSRVIEMRDGLILSQST